MSTPPPTKRNVSNANRQRQMDADLGRRSRDPELLSSKYLNGNGLVFPSNKPMKMPAVQSSWEGVHVSSANGNYQKIFGTKRKSRKSHKTRKMRKSRSRKSRKSNKL